MWQYKLFCEIGRGAYGKVYKARDQSSKDTRMVALKRFSRPKEALREKKILRQLRDIPNVINLIGCFDDYLVLQYCETDLGEYIDCCRETQEGKSVPRSQVQRLTQQILEGIRFCHKLGWMHRDLKPNNILLDANMNVKIADFGLGRKIDHPRMGYTAKVVTRYYRAPEILLHEGRSQYIDYTEAIDMWAVGCVVAEMCLGKAFFDADTDLHQLHLILRMFSIPIVHPAISKHSDLRHAHPSIPDFKKLFPLADLECRRLLERLLTYDPSQRISAQEACNHPYLRSTLSVQAQVPEISFAPRLDGIHPWKPQQSSALSTVFHFTAGGDGGNNHGRKPMQA